MYWDKIKQLIAWKLDNLEIEDTHSCRDGARPVSTVAAGNNINRQQ